MNRRYVEILDTLRIAHAQRIFMWMISKYLMARKDMVTHVVTGPTWWQKFMMYICCVSHEHECVINGGTYKTLESIEEK